jgi:hypothetical protein
MVRRAVPLSEIHNDVLEVKIDRKVSETDPGKLFSHLICIFHRKPRGKEGMKTNATEECGGHRSLKRMTRNKTNDRKRMAGIRRQASRTAAGSVSRHFRDR